MALVFINGFDDNMHSGSVVGSAISTFDTGTFRTGTTSLKANSASSVSSVNMLTLPIPGGGDTTMIIGCALYAPAVGNIVLGQFLSDNGGTIHVTLVLALSTGLLQVWRGNNSTGTVIGSVTLSGSAIATGTWGYWEFKCTLSDTVGEVHVRYNSAAVLDITGADTKNAGTKTVIDTVAYANGLSTVGIAFTDDYYLVTGTGAPNDFLGDCKVQTVYPNGNGDYSQLVGSDADSVNNYLLVNETGAPVTTSYVESDTVARRDFYTMGDISIPSNATVLGVQVTAWCNNPDAGSGRAVKIGVRQGTSEALTASLPLTAATFLAERGMFTVDPATGAAWSQSGVNSAQAGVEVA
jgi:hypothetical protein